MWGRAWRKHSKTRFVTICDSASTVGGARFRSFARHLRFEALPRCSALFFRQRYRFAVHKRFPQGRLHLQSRAAKTGGQGQWIGYRGARYTSVMSLR
jgi:hypothetical protein